MSDESVVEEQDTEEPGGLRSPLSRRNLLKTGAIIGGTVWAAPVIDSFVSRAAAVSAAPGAFPCSYATIIFSLNGTVYAVKLNDPSPGCNLNNTDGSYKGETIGTCGSNTFAVNSMNDLTLNGTTIPDAPSGSCSFFTINGSTVSWSGVTVLFVLIHDGSFGGPGCPAGTLTNGTGLCNPSGSFTIPAGCCGTSAG